MSEIIAFELKSDLEYVYKVTGDLLNELEGIYSEGNGSINNEMLERLRFGLVNTGAVLQKDIFNCDFIITKLQFKYNANKNANKNSE